jgi:hypothetical protein
MSFHAFNSSPSSNGDTFKEAILAKIKDSDLLGGFRN